MPILRWRQISEAPSEPGIYAWYYAPEITAFDLDAIVAKVSNLRASGRLAEATEAIETFLHDSVFRYFQETPYEAVLKGPLKPRYSGTIRHAPSLSKSLVARLVEDPLRLRTVREVLEASVPELASPLYIGMAKKLKTRLNRHKTLIEQYGERPATDPDDLAPEAGEDQDVSFAREIHARRIPTGRLFVAVRVIPVTDRSYVDVENILNRIHFPLLGRN